MIEAGIYNIDLASIQEINRYFFYGGIKNMTNALRYIAANVLKLNYLELEGEIEERLGDVKGEIQAGSIDVMTDADIKEWQDKLKEVSDLFD
ncbi:MAG: hypothetical protein WBI44_03420 [Syntrophaceticus sp.]